MSTEERIEFNCDAKTIDWRDFILSYAKGIAIWIMGEDQVMPSENLS